MGEEAIGAWNEAWEIEGQKDSLALITCFDGIIAAATGVGDEHLGIDLYPETGERKVIYHFFGEPECNSTPEEEIDKLFAFIFGQSQVQSALRKSS